ncbi:MAG TPA: hypothetical protein VM598_02310, partial [Bdellovibrionota bacterium]|nr:hypothetical protein [Bdellovibrionota bacterium]
MSRAASGVTGTTGEPQLRSHWRRFLGVHAVFGLLYGFFGAYSLLYLGVQLKAAGMRGSILDQLLPILGATMLLDSIIGPFAGNYADARGRRRATTLSLLFLALSLGCGLLMSAVVFDPGLSFLVFDLGVAAQIFMSLSAAFYATSLDAWWVDLLHDGQRTPTGSSMHRYFSRQAQVTGLFLVLGGAASLFLGPSLTGGLGSRFGVGSWETGTRIFWAGIALCVALAAAIRHGLPLPSRDGRWAMGLADELKWKTASAWKLPGLRRALVVTSVVYVCFTAFLYLVPLLLNDSSIGVGGGAGHHWVRENYWIFYLTMGSARFLGPVLSGLIRFEKEGSRRREFALWASLVCASLLATGLAYAFLPFRWIDIALPLVFLTRVLAEAFKPVQAAYLNELVAWRSMRAFALSLTTAMGSLFVATIAFVLILEYSLYERALESWARPAKS